MREFAQFIHYLFYLNPNRCHEIMGTVSGITQWREELEGYLLRISATPDQATRLRGLTQKFQENPALLDLSSDFAFILSTDPEYPEVLRHISDPPFLLYYKGDLSLLKNPLLGVVGPRVPSDYGRQVTEHLVKGLCGYFGIVSGLAQGIDTVAHRSALGSDLGTIAVMGTSFDTVYPASNSGLFQEICKSGLVLSEYPIGVGSMGVFFSRRNRIITGLSRGVLIIEAGEKSGALVSGRYAMEQNRDVFAVPGSIFSKSSIGTHRLIQDGAKLVSGIQDVLDEYYDLQPKPVEIEEGLQLSFPVDLSEDETKVFSALSQVQPLGLDELSQSTGLLIHQLLQTLTILELNGHISTTSGQRYVRK